MPEDIIDQLKELLINLFRIEEINFDYGINRIINIKRKLILNFIEVELPEKVKKSLAEIQDGRLVEKEIFSYVYHFFKRYYKEGDFLSNLIYSSEPKYYIPYDGSEVNLYWSNRDQYFIKTSEVFEMFVFRVGEFKIIFKLSDIEYENNKEKAIKRRFVLKGGEEFVFNENDKEYTIYFEFRALTSEEKKLFGTRNTQQTINPTLIEKILDNIQIPDLKEGLQKTLRSGNNLLEENIKKYTKKNLEDYFIHKNLKGFLENELDFYIKNEILKVNTLIYSNIKNIATSPSIIIAQVVYNIAKDIIAFLAQIEEFQKFLWEKKSFVIETNYCITLDKIPEEFYPKIVDNQKQIDEWKRLFYIEGVSGETLDATGVAPGTVNESYLKRNISLVLDTKFFSKDFKDRLLATFDNIDEEIDGLLIKSENWQALNLIFEKFQDIISCIYIDPPYNTGSDGFNFKDSFKHSSWLTMMANRLELSQKILPKEGTISISIGEEENYRLRFLMDMVFEENNFRNNILIRRYDKNLNRQFEDLKTINVGAENILIYTNSATHSINPIYREASKERQSKGYWKGFWNSSNRPTMRYPILGVKIEKGQWKWSETRARKAIENYKTFQKDFQKKITLEEYWDKTGRKLEFIRRNPDGRGKNKGIDNWISPSSGILRNSNWTDLLASKGLKQLGIDFSNPKNLEVIENIVEMTSDSTDIILDFFAGSGTTAHAVMNLNNKNPDSRRKYILIEMEKYFEDILKKRLLRVIYSNEWKNPIGAEHPVPKPRNGNSHMLKYISLEQYEDKLNNIEFTKGVTVQRNLENLEGYKLEYLFNTETMGSLSRLNLSQFENPFEYKLKILDTNSTRDNKSHPNKIIDIIETFNYLLGINVIDIRVFNNDVYYKTIRGFKSGKKYIIIWRAIKELDFEKDKEFIESQIIKDEIYDYIYINGASFVDNHLLIEGEFKKKMGC